MRSAAQLALVCSLSRPEVHPQAPSSRHVTDDIVLQFSLGRTGGCSLVEISSHSLAIVLEYQWKEEVGHLICDCSILSSLRWISNKRVLVDMLMVIEETVFISSHGRIMKFFWVHDVECDNLLSLSVTGDLRARGGWSLLQLVVFIRFPAQAKAARLHPCQTSNYLAPVGHLAFGASSESPK